MKHILKAVLCLSTLMVLHAAESAEGTKVITLESLSVLANSPSSLTNLVHDAEKSQDIYNAVVGNLRDPIIGPSTNAYLQFIKDFNINFKVFDADTGGDAALGFDYAFDRSVVGRTIDPEGNNPLGLSFSVNAKGNVAFDINKNPDDFLETGFKLHLFQSIGGWEPTVKSEIVPALNRDGTPKMGKDGKPETITKAQELINQLKLDLTEEQRAKDKNWQEFLQFINRNSRLQVFWDVAGSFSLESNQDFSERQLAYGAQFGGLIRAWNPNSAWAKWNILDFPFAAVRYLTQTDKEWSPSGQALPGVILGLDLVDPLADPARFAVDSSEEPYPRFRAEVAFKTRVLRWKNNDVWLSLNYRYFQEIDAPASIRSANLAQSKYFAAMLDLIYGLNITYSTGRLPLDSVNDNVIALGWKLNF